MPHERWVAVPRWEGLYEVSDLGRVRSLPRIVMAGKSPRQIAGKVLKPSWNGDYLRVTLTDGRRKEPTCVHVLVLKAFRGNRPGHWHQWHGCHSDGNHGNNELRNLRWGTPASNAADTVAHGRSIKGEGSASAKLTETSVLEIKRRLSSDKVNRSALAREFDVSRRAISHIETGKTWYWLDPGIAFPACARESEPLEQLHSE